MAWKLKRTKSDEDEPKTKGLKGSSDDVSAEYEHKPGAFEPVAGYDTEYGEREKTVMLLNDSDYLPGFIPNTGGPAASADAPEIPAAPDDDLSSYLRGDAATDHAAAPAAAPEEDFISSALSSADEAVSSFQTAKGDPINITPAAADDGQNAGSSENWDLDAFAPYQPAANGVHADAPVVETPIVESHAATARLSSSNGAAPSVPLSDSLTPPRLVVRLGQFSASYEVSKSEVTIGRPDPRIDLFPDLSVEWDDAVSRNHARILHRADGDYVEDTGSTNGTKLNSVPLAPNSPQPLKDGDKIQVGEKTEIVYMR